MFVIEIVKELIKKYKIYRIDRRRAELQALLRTNPKSFNKELAKEFNILTCKRELVRLGWKKGRDYGVKK